MGASDLWVAVTRRKLACVVDPLLALGSPHGAALTLRLAHAFEAWLPRSFWQVLDASELIVAGAADEPEPRPDDRALAAWLALRDSTDAGSWVLRWVGDNVAESHLREAGPIDLVDRSERLHESLLEQLPDAQGPAGWSPCGDALVGAPDVLALSAALDGALVLCAAAPGGPAPDGLAPAPPVPLVALLQRAGVQPQGPVPADDSGLWTAERAWVREALAAAGAVPLLQGLPRLAALHVLAGQAESPWNDARAWWYWI